MSKVKNEAFDFLKNNETATAAVLELVAAACHGGQSHGALVWAAEGDNLKKLRDKIKESASEK